MSFWKEKIIGRNADLVIRMAEMTARQDAEPERFVSSVCDDRVHYLYKQAGLEVIGEEWGDEGVFLVISVQFFMVYDVETGVFTGGDAPLGVVQGDSMKSIVDRCGEPTSVRNPMNVPVLGSQPVALFYDSEGARVIITLGGPSGTVSKVSINTMPRR